MRSVTEGLEFTFNNTMNAQVDEISMGPVFANISLVFFYESLVFEKYCKPHVCLFYVYDSFSIFDSINDAEAFHAQINSLHPSF